MTERDEFIAQVRRAIEEIRQAIERDDIAAIDELLDQLELALPPESTVARPEQSGD
jgi:hypothetical protein